jgi:hypothetical protein
MTLNETGLLTLVDACQLPKTPYFPPVQTWEELLSAISALINEPHDHRTLVIDALGGAERLCHEYVCERNYGGNWGNTGFSNFMVGYDVALAEWRVFLDALDYLRAARRMSILTLAHCRIALQKNPEGNDYDRYVPDLHHKTWTLTQKWADLVVFMKYATVVETDRNDGKGKGKGKGGTRRVLHTTHAATFDAKNRHGLPEEIDGGNCAAEAWANLSAAVKAAKQQQQQQQQDSPADDQQPKLESLPADGQQATSTNQE